ncbi:MAG: hypothetical protein RI565_02360 [Schleiferiaceae bacterium]|nr:hypothetical protein [Schleiferiaceae bacterium]
MDNTTALKSNPSAQRRPRRQTIRNILAYSKAMDMVPEASNGPWELNKN